MRTATPQLTAFLNSGRVAICFDLWTFALGSGQTVQWTNGDRTTLHPDGRVFATGRGVPIIERGTITWQRGVQTDQLDVTLKSDATVMLAGQTLAQFATADGFAGAAVLLERAFFNEDGVLQGSLIWFVGVVADVEPDRYQVAITVRDDLSKLDIMMPRGLYQPGCGNTLYDARCSVNSDLFATYLSVSGVDPSNLKTSVRCVFSSRPSGWFDLGRLRFTSGANAGLTRVIKVAYTAGSITVFILGRPFPFDIGLNDSFIAWAGCDKQQSTCSGKFNNNAFEDGRFEGTPYIPDATTVT